jgi:diguanylate cyclase (GGDEF)-like protein
MQRELTYQQRVLERIARGDPLADTLDYLCRHVERLYPGAKCTMLIVDRAAGVLRHGACPTLRPEFIDAIDGLPVGEGMAACGTAAARGEIVIVENVSRDPLTSAFVDLGARFGLASVWSHPLRSAQGEVLGTFAVYRSVPHRPSRSELRTVTNVGNLAALAIARAHAEQALQAAANLDQLTGLPNRARFLELVNEELESSDHELAVMYLELDRLKQINDSLGRLAGDRILAEAADRLRVVVGEDGLTSRFGDFEFTVLAHVTGSGPAKALADRLLAAIETPFVLDGGEFFLTANIGIARDRPAVDGFGLVLDAEIAMSAARARGPGSRQVYGRRLGAQAIDRLNMETELRRAIERRELVLHYQPILSLVEPAWTGVEALIRWQHPKRGMVRPDEFIPLAEETGLIVPLGERVLEMVTKQAQEWSETLPGIRIAANASVVQLADPRIARQLLRMLKRASVSPSAILIEVTESALMQEVETTRSALDQITSSGIQVLIDDFGTGYSSLARLGELPITGLKIDRRFTGALSNDSSARPVVRAIAELASAYGLEVVAEGIEDALALREAQALGCHFAQGYHLGRPAEASVIEAALRQPPPV